MNTETTPQPPSRVSIKTRHVTAPVTALSFLKVLGNDGRELDTGPRARPPTPTSQPSEPGQTALFLIIAHGSYLKLFPVREETGDGAGSLGATGQNPVAVSEEMFERAKIHGIRLAESTDSSNRPECEKYRTLAIFGSKFLRVLRINLVAPSFSPPNTLTHGRDQPHTFPDWILEVKWVPDDNLAVLTAHNLLHLFSPATGQIIKSVQCPERSLSYAGAMWGQSFGNLIVASGTVMAGVVVWTPEADNGTANGNETLESVEQEPPVPDGVDTQPDSRSAHTIGSVPKGSLLRPWNSAQHLSHAVGTVVTRCEGHDGAVFSVSFDSSGRYLITAGDDRTVRTWDLATSTESIRNITEPSTTSFGHISRVWRAVFIPPVSTASVDEPPRYSVSASEDATARVWQLPLANQETHGKLSAQCVTVLGGGTGKRGQGWRGGGGGGHEKRNIWSIDVAVMKSQVHTDGFRTLVATGGGDGGVRLWDCTSNVEEGDGGMPIVSWRVLARRQEPNEVDESMTADARQHKRGRGKKKWSARENVPGIDNATQSLEQESPSRPSFISFNLLSASLLLVVDDRGDFYVQPIISNLKSGVIGLDSVPFFSDARFSRYVTLSSCPAQFSTSTLVVVGNQAGLFRAVLYDPLTPSPLRSTEWLVGTGAHEDRIEEIWSYYKHRDSLTEDCWDVFSFATGGNLWWHRITFSRNVDAAQGAQQIASLTYVQRDALHVAVTYPKGTEWIVGVATYRGTVELWWPDSSGAPTRLVVIDVTLNGLAVTSLSFLTSSPSQRELLLTTTSREGRWWTWSVALPLKSESEYEANDLRGVLETRLEEQSDVEDDESLLNEDGVLNPSVTALIDGNNGAIRLNGMRVTMGWLEGMLPSDSGSPMVVWGFRSARFFVYDVRLRREVFFAVCGGAHRRWHVKAEQQSDGSWICAFIFFKAGGVWLHKSVPLAVKVPNITKVIQPSFHGMGISCIEPLDFGESTSISIATGGDDGAIRLSSFSAAEVTPFNPLVTYPSHFSGVRSLTSPQTYEFDMVGDLSQIEGSPSWLLSGGGKGELIAWRVLRGRDGVSLGMVAKGSEIM
ncbi:hypothetical protein HDU93_002229 [Gonapodya sp. JEL0774]|nr:hypothetical protein HDU93_002229 [Gonapodya sp. JEL0774]